MMCLGAHSRCNMKVENDIMAFKHSVVKSGSYEKVDNTKLNT